MPLEFEPQERREEPRYDTQTVRKVASLAQKLQARHQETLTAREIEEAGQEAGLDPAFMRAALAQVTAAETPVRTVQSPVATTAADTEPGSLHRVVSAFTAAWWSAGWAIPVFILGPHHPSGFGIGMGLYIGGGVFLSALVPERKKAGKKKKAEGPTEGSAEPLTGSPQHSRAAMLEVLFSLQRQLEGQKEHRAFVSIDVAGSTRMKLGASDLAVEYSFGQLRSYIAAIVEAHHGSVQSHAGDGFMCAFRDDSDALRAVREIQSRLPELNDERNRLAHPFRLRCGVSAGEVAMEPGTPLGHLNSTVIDRAATFQKSAPPDGVALGPELAGIALVELGDLNRLPDPVDGSPAFSWRPGT